MRSLSSLFGLPRKTSQAPRGPKSRRNRRPVVERLEDRLALTTTVFLDFGEGFVSGELQMTANQRRQEFFPYPYPMEERFDGIRGPDFTDDFPSGRSGLLATNN